MKRAHCVKKTPGVSREAPGVGNGARDKTPSSPEGDQHYIVTRQL